MIDELSIKYEPHPIDSRFIDLTDHKYGRLKVLGFAGATKFARFWWCKCDCGTIRKYQAGNLRAKEGSKGCHGCKLAKKNKSHGMSGSSVYMRWRNLKANGTLCDAWKTFSVFYADTGTPSRQNMKLCRPDLSKPFQKDNFYWGIGEGTTNAGRKIAFNGHTKSIAGWAKELGISREGLRLRMLRMPLSVALKYKRGQIPIEYSKLGRPKACQ